MVIFGRVRNTARGVMGMHHIIDTGDRADDIDELTNLLSVDYGSNTIAVAGFVTGNVQDDALRFGEGYNPVRQRFTIS